MTAAVAGQAARAAGGRTAAAAGAGATAATVAAPERPTAAPADTRPPARSRTSRAATAVTGRFPRGRAVAAGGVQNGAGFLLALVVWGWVVMPFIQGGPAAVRDVIRAKFINRGADGSWLP